jgi:uncharacterized protein (DUF1800 family)
MARLSPLVEHLYRRAGFGLSPADRQQFAAYTPVTSPRTGRTVSPGTGGASYREVVESLVNYNAAAADVDARIGTPGHVNITTVGPFIPNRDIGHARQRWLFRMVHSPAPLQEKMALIWHHHFATAVSKIAGVYGPLDSTRLMAAKPSEDPVRQRGQIELFRQYALGNFRDLLIAVAQDPAMLVWLDGVTNFKRQPQENFGRELMELFTFGVEHYTESDVYAAARVFTGWNLQTTGTIGSGNATFRFLYNPAEHDTAAKDFSFRIYYSRRSGGSGQIPARTSSAGIQDGLDLINALAFHPETARRMARRLWVWFVSETEVPDDRFVRSIAQVYLNNNTNMRAVMRAVLMSSQFQDSRSHFKRYAWPAEYVVRALKEVGYLGFSVNDAATQMVGMGQQLFEPPDVNGWDIGPLWFSTGAMLARMNFASSRVTNQRVALREAARPFKATPESLVGFGYDTLTLPTPHLAETTAVADYVRMGGTWTGSDTQLLAKAAGVIHLLAGTGEYQFV